MKRFLFIGLVAAGCVVALAAGSGCRTARKHKASAPTPAAITAAPAKPAASELATATPRRKSWIGRLFSSKESVPSPSKPVVAATPPPPVTKPAPAPAAVAATQAKEPAVTAPAKPAASDLATSAPRRKSWIGRLFSSKDPATAKNMPATAITQAPPVEVVTPKLTPTYHIQFNDQVVIALTGIPQEQRFDVIVDENGFIKLPYIDNIKAVGKTSAELEVLIHDAYINQKIYRRITVNVATPNQFQTFFYFVRGEIRGSGGRMQWVNGMTILQAVAAAGGPNDFASPRIKITRGEKTFTVNLDDLAKHPEKDQPVLPGDVIVVSRSFL